MSLPRMPAWAGRRRGGRLAGAALLVVLALAAVCPPGRADDADPFTATVAVDATADSVVKARETARLDGQRRAFASVVERLSGGNAPGKLAKLDDNAITNLVASFEVAHERMSPVRYQADYTFHFRPEAVKQMLAAAGIAAAGNAAGGESRKPAIVLPLFQSEAQLRLWDEPNPWREAWEQQPTASGPARLVVPLGDAGDITAIDADKAQAGDAAALAAVARHNGGDDAVVALAAMRGPPDKPTGVDVTLRRYRAGQLIDTHSLPLDANPGETADNLLRRAVTATVADIESRWQKPPVASYDQQGSLTAVLPIQGLDDWVQVRRRIAAVTVIRKIALVALSRQEATIEISYVGTIDDLKAGLAGTGLNLVHGDPLWQLARTGPGPTP
jgi:Uncharacterized protein conserved in bacteria (DUF2066)